MPHSSGGGSHSGGSSHSSSSHSGGSSGGGSSYSTRSSYFPGAHRYVCYTSGSPEYIYSDNPNLNDTGKARLLLLLVYIPFICGLFSLIVQSINIPKKLPAKYSESVVIEDYVGVMGNTTALKQTLYEFYNTTGIPVTLITSDNEWKYYYNSIENYAYDEYVNRYPDEDHWVLIYTTDYGDTFENWYFHGMQGYNTDPILTTKVTDKFDDNLTKYLYIKGTSVEDAFTMAFRDIIPGIMKPSVNLSQIGIAIGMGAFIGLHMFFMVFYNPNKKYKDYVKCPDDTALDDNPHAHEANCEYCGGLYYRGSVTECPHCGAPVRSSRAKRRSPNQANR